MEFEQHEWEDAIARVIYENDPQYLALPADQRLPWSEVCFDDSTEEHWHYAEAIFAFIADKLPKQADVLEASRHPCRSAINNWMPIETAPHGVELLLAWEYDTDCCYSPFPTKFVEVGYASWDTNDRGSIKKHVSFHREAQYWQPLPKFY